MIDSGSALRITCVAGMSVIAPIQFFLLRCIDGRMFHQSALDSRQPGSNVIVLLVPLSIDRHRSSDRTRGKGTRNGGYRNRRPYHHNCPGDDGYSSSSDSERRGHGRGHSRPHGDDRSNSRSTNLGSLYM
jgi:hypothetical protein